MLKYPDDVSCRLCYAWLQLHVHGLHAADALMQRVPFDTTDVLQGDLDVDAKAIHVLLCSMKGDIPRALSLASRAIVQYPQNAIFRHIIQTLSPPEMDIYHLQGLKENHFLFRRDSFCKHKLEFYNLLVHDAHMLDMMSNLLTDASDSCKYACKRLFGSKHMPR